MPYGWVRSWFPCSIFQRKTKMSKLIAPLSGANFKKQDPFAAGGVTGKSVDLMKSSYNLKSLIANGTIHGGTYEHEVGKAIEKQTGQSAQGCLVPSEVLARGMVQQRSALAAGTNNLGGFTIQTSVQPAIANALIPFSSLVASKITVLDGLTSNISWPRWQTGFSPSGAAENTTVTDLNSETFSVLQIGPPSRMNVQLKLSGTLLKQTGFDCEAAVQREILRAIGSTVDLYCLNQILATPENTGTNRDFSKLATGAPMPSAATWSQLVGVKQTILQNDVVNDGTMSWIVSPTTYGRWSNIQKATNYPLFLIEHDQAVDLPVRVSNNLTYADVPHTALLGRWSDAVLGLFGIDIVSDPFSGASVNQIFLSINILYSFGLLRGPSVAKTEDSAAQ